MSQKATFSLSQMNDVELTRTLSWRENALFEEREKNVPSHNNLCLYLIGRSSNVQYLVLPYKPNISLIHSILYYKLFAYICKFLYLYNIILADIYA